jgi:hypothetical protein
MANETFTSDAKRFDELIKQFSGTVTDVEKVLNDYIHNEAPKTITPSIVGLVPVSDRSKKHAKNSNPFGRQENYNLAVKIITSKQFNYLVFPDEGLGTSHENQPQDFTGRGLEATLPDLLDEMMLRIQNELTK